MQNEKLVRIRHSLAHLLAIAAIEKDPKVKLAIGPTIDNGFYYDFEFSDSINISQEDIGIFEARIKDLIAESLPFIGREVTAGEAREIFKDQPYKLELIDELEKVGEKITVYSTGDFTDLCRGGHVDNTSEIPADSFALTHTAGAYWRGDEKNKMLTRIYGLAFENKQELEKYQTMIDEAKKRDHRKIGKDLKLFTFDDDVGPGLPLWLPNGSIIIEELEKLARDTENKEGYSRVRTPHIAKESMYLKSGHLPYYAESMFPPMEYEGGKYYLRAMNCPHHHKIFQSEPRSYKDMPVRLAEYGTVYRHEKSGELFGLMRVRMMQMNDAHIYCTEDQFAEEFRRVNNMYLSYFKIFNVDKYVMRFSTHDPKKLGQKYVNEPAIWEKTEKMVRDVLIESNIPYVEVSDEAAFYGPKIDVQVWSAIGREFTLATNQVDFAVPRRFNLTYKNNKGEDEIPLIIHRAPLGTHERFIGFLIEHYGGAFPVWLSPVQAIILPISEKHVEYAGKICSQLREAGIRTELDDSDESLGKKIRAAKTVKTPYMLVIGDAEVNENTVTVESRDRGKIGAQQIGTFISSIGQEISEKK